MLVQREPWFFLNNQELFVTNQDFSITNQD